MKCYLSEYLTEELRENIANKVIETPPSMNDIASLSDRSHLFINPRQIIFIPKMNEAPVKKLTKQK